MIRVEQLTKQYGNTLAIDGISFDVAPGEIVGFLGPNGAGKSTTMRILVGLLAPTSGTVWIGPHNIHTESLAARRHIGFLPEIVPLYGEMTVRDYLTFVADLQGVEKSWVRVDEVAEKCGLSERLKTHAGKLSHGYRQRVGLAAALIHEPAILILDEPTTGLDPVQIVEIRQLIRGLGTKHTVLLSTHILPEAAQICDRVMIINRGKIVGGCSLSRVNPGMRALVLRLKNSDATVMQTLCTVPGILEVEPWPGETASYRLTCSQDARPEGDITRTVVGHGWDLMELSIAHTELEDIFMRAVGQLEG